MNYFIEQIAKYIHEENLELTHLKIILPSQRAKKYLQRALFKEYKTSLFSPQIITMNSWIQNLSLHPIMDSTSAVFKLYETHLKIDKKNPQSLDEFLKWGRILLSDFDEIDRYLIDSKDLFKNLADIREIENWSFNSEEELSEGQKKFMEFWNLLQDYYQEFNLQLEKEQKTYLGKAYKYVATNLDSVFKEDKKATFIFAGFNALSPAETSIMRQLEKMGKAKIFIDADAYYIDNKLHEAGLFMRNFMQEMKVNKLPFIQDSIRHSPKNIKIYNCAQVTGQAKISASLLYDQIPANEISETLLLLADEQLIVPVMKNIPKNVGETNITLGLPLRNTALKSWVDILFMVQEHFLQFRTKNIYHKDFIRFIKHPFVIGYCTKQEIQEINQLENTIHSKNWIFIFIDKLSVSERIKKLIHLFFEPWENSYSKLPENIFQLNEMIYGSLDKEKNAIERAVIYNFNQSIKSLDKIIAEYRPQISLSTFKMIFNQHWSNESIAYYGNPLEGLQVMGLLETRLLDFKNVLIIGLNEGSLPPTNPIQTMIPMDLRRFHKLPLPRDKQGLFAHHFYRLFHHAENIWITYSSADRDFGGMDEPSRYIAQIELELAHANPDITIEKYDYVIQKEEENIGAIQVEKTPAVLQRLDEYFAHKTSASALKTALHCPLDFYYKYLLGMGEMKDIEEDIEANTFGSFIHDTLEKLYSNFAQFDAQGNKQDSRRLTTLDFEGMLKEYPSLLTKHFQEFFNYSSQQQIEGRNFLSLEMAIYLTGQFLKKEQQLLKEEKSILIDSVERELSKTLYLEIQGEKKEVRFIGILDRIDEINGEKRIIDYKTGRCSIDDVRINQSKDKSEEGLVTHLIAKITTTKYVFQLLIYNMLFFEHFGYYPDKVGIISMVNLNEGPYFLVNELTDTTEELMIVFEKALMQIISDLYDDEKMIEHTVGENYCNYCIV